MYRACLFTICLLLFSGCLLFLDDPADFPDAPTDASCGHDASTVADWEFKGSDDVDDDESDQ